MRDRSGNSVQSADQSLVIGWREPVALPEWGIKSIKTKIDTGARTSAIHVDNIVELPNDRVRFDVIVRMNDDPDGPHETVPIETDVVRISCVRPTTGLRQHRLVVRTRFRLGPIEREIELSLVSRHRMLCRLLLGRLALDGAFLIDPGVQMRLTRPKRSPRRERSP